MSCLLDLSGRPAFFWRETEAMDLGEKQSEEGLGLVEESGIDIGMYYIGEEKKKDDYHREKRKLMDRCYAIYA